MSNNTMPKKPTLWGFAGPWYGELIPYKGDVFQEKLEFLARYNLNVASAGLRQVVELSPERQDWLLSFLTEHNMQLCPYIGWNYIETDGDEAQRKTEETIANLQTWLPQLNSSIVITGPGPGHRFDRTRPVEEKLERLSNALAPLAKCCYELGVSLALENHGEFYCSETAQVCRETPHLGFFLDTGNTYLIGEKPLPACEEAAPYVVGTHFKDHRVQPRPDARPLHFEVAGAVLGEGDVPLRECFDILMKNTPQPENLVMEIEMVAPEGVNPLEAFEKSLDFVRSL